VTAIHVPAGINGDEIRKKLRVERGYVLGGGQEKLAGKIIRIGTMGAVTQNDIVEMLTALETELIAAGHNAKTGSAAKAATEAFRSASQPVPA
jgi:aspartate aminotransferase-like enzyme